MRGVRGFRRSRRDSRWFGEAGETPGARAGTVAGQDIAEVRHPASQMSEEASMTVPGLEAIVFDLGGVLIDWNPRHLYRSIFGADEAAMEAFLAEVCTPEWNELQDAGRPWDEAIESLAREHPAQRELIAAYHRRWEETLRGPIEGSVAIVGELRVTPIRLLALTNWSAEKWPYARARFGFLEWFEAIVVSGEVGIAKPDPRIFRFLIERFAIDPARTLYVDDSPVNVSAAAALGFVAWEFVGAMELRRDLVRSGVLPEVGAVSRSGGRS
jgi:2-haloacid dehalogenase